jgi:hypothetical protein
MLPLNVGLGLLNHLVSTHEQRCGTFNPGAVATLRLKSSNWVGCSIGSWRLDSGNNLIDYFGREYSIAGIVVSCGADFRVSDVVPVGVRAGQPCELCVHGRL